MEEISSEIWHFGPWFDHFDGDTLVHNCTSYHSNQKVFTSLCEYIDVERHGSISFAVLKSAIPLSRIADIQLVKNSLNLSKVELGLWNSELNVEFEKRELSSERWVEFELSSKHWVKFEIAS